MHNLTTTSHYPQPDAIHNLTPPPASQQPTTSHNPQPHPTHNLTTTYNLTTTHNPQPHPTHNLTTSHNLTTYRLTKTHNLTLPPAYHPPNTTTHNPTLFTTSHYPPPNTATHTLTLFTTSHLLSITSHCPPRHNTPEATTPARLKYRVSAETFFLSFYFRVSRKAPYSQCFFCHLTLQLVQPPIRNIPEMLSEEES